MSVCGVSRELGVWRMKQHEIEVWFMPDAFGVSRELAHENMLISFCVRVCVSRELGVRTWKYVDFHFVSPCHECENIKLPRSRPFSGLNFIAQN